MKIYNHYDDFPMEEWRWPNFSDMSFGLDYAVGVLPVGATVPEAEAGTDNTKYMTPLRTAQAIAALAFGPMYESAEQTITISSKLTLVHGLGGQPKRYTLHAVCKTAEHGYAVGEEIELPTASQNGVVIRSAQIAVDATNIYVRTGSTLITGNDTGTLVTMTPANWRYVVRAWRDM